MWKQTTDNTTPWVVPLTEVLEAGLVPGAETIGGVLDAIIARGDAVGVDPDGRLAIAQPALDRLRQEQAERERIAREEAEKAEAERAARLEEEAARREAQKRERDRARAYRERVARLEKAMGTPLHQIERAIREESMYQAGTGGTFDHLQDAASRTFSLEEIEEWVIENYGAAKLEQEGERR